MWYNIRASKLTDKNQNLFCACTRKRVDRASLTWVPRILIRTALLFHNEVTLQATDAT